MVHGLQADQSSNLQSRSHEPVLHGRSSWTVSQPLPPFFGFVNTDLVFVSTPLSQSLVHFDQPDHSDIKQSTGHFFCPHSLLGLCHNPCR